MSFAFIGWTADKIAIQASDFRVSSVDRLRGLSVDCAAEARKINEPTIAALLGLPRKLVHSWSAKKSTNKARVQQ